MTGAEIIAALERAPVLSALDRADLEALAPATRARQLGANEVLWGRGQSAEYLGIVLMGRLKVTRQQKRRELIVELLGPGDLVGDVALSLKATYQFHVVCLRRARVLLVPTRVLRSLLERRPKASVALAFELAKQVLRLTRQVEALTAGDVEQRLARVMIGLVDRFGEPFPGGVLVPVRLRREDLASLAATTLESTSRRLSEWKRAGIVSPQPSGYLIRDVARLRGVIDTD